MAKRKKDRELAEELYEKEDVIEIKPSGELIREFDKKISEVLFARQEAGILHNSFEWGMDVYECIKRGDKQNLIGMLQKRGEWRFGVLAEEELRSIKNRAICMISFVVQSLIIEKLLYNEICYSISDACIQWIEESSAKEEIATKLYLSLVKLTDEIQLHKEKNYHYLVKRTKEYIYKHFHEELTVEKTAEALGITPDYLSKIFKKAEGVSLKRYILQERITRAENLLRYSEYSIIEISKYLGFSTQSHFTQVFKKYCGMTPQAFRNQYSEGYQDKM